MDFFTADRAVYGAVAAVVSLVLSGVSTRMFSNANPPLWLFVSFCFGRLGDRLNKTHRTGGDLWFRGFIIFALALGVCLALAYAVETLRGQYALCGMVEAGILALGLASGGLWLLAFELAGVAGGQVRPQSRIYLTLARTMHLNLALADEHTVARRMMEMLARRFDRGFIAPLFWYMALGLPGFLVMTFLSALDWRLGKGGFTKGFSAFFSGLERLMAFIPSLISAVFLVLASFIAPGAGVWRSLKAFCSVTSIPPMAQGGLPLKIMAHGFGVTLGGAGQDMSGSAIKAEWVDPGQASARIGSTRLRHAAYFTIIASLLAVTVLCGFYVLSVR